MGWIIEIIVDFLFTFLFTRTGEVILFIVTLGRHMSRWDLYATSTIRKLSFWIGAAFWCVVAVLMIRAIQALSAVASSPDGKWVVSIFRFFADYFPFLCSFLFIALVAVLLRLPRGAPAKKIAMGSAIGWLLGILLFLGVSHAVMGTGPGYKFDLMLEIKNLFLEVTFISPGAVVGGIIAYNLHGDFLSDERRQILDERRQILTVAVGSVIGVIASTACFFVFLLLV